MNFDINFDFNPKIPRYYGTNGTTRERRRERAGTAFLPGNTCLRGRKTTKAALMRRMGRL